MGSMGKCMRMIVYKIALPCAVIVLTLFLVAPAFAAPAPGNTKALQPVARTAKTTQVAASTTKSSTVPKDAQAMYRLYKPATGEHFYTSSVREKRILVQRRGWFFEGVGWYAPKKSATPVYRLCQLSTNAHHYTTSKNERDTLRKRGWKYEGIGWYSDDAKTIKVHRLVKPGAPMVRAHHYTTSTNERNTLIKSRGWKSEGIGWYALAEGHSLKDGWIKKAGKWTYWLEGKQVKNRWVVTQQRPTKKSDTGIRRYRIDANGFAQTGFFILDGAKYYGIPSKIHVVHYAHHHDAAHTLVANSAGKLYNNGSGWKWSKEYSSDKSNQRYYFEKTKDGKAMGARVGLFKMGGKQYYGYPTKGYVARNTIVVVNGKRYRANANGVLTQIKLRVYLDAGHGWYNNSFDSGAVGSGYRECDLTSDLAGRVLQRAKNIEGVEVIDGRQYRMPYQQRNAKAAALGCDLVLSIHFNAGGGSGTMTLIGGSNRPAKERIWNDIVHQRVMNALGLRDEGTIRRWDLYITNGSVPCVLVEVCHVDVWSDMVRYNNRRDRVAQALADSIRAAANDPRLI